MKNFLYIVKKKVMYKVNREETEPILEDLGFDVGGMQDFCENAIESDLESYINGYMLFITNEERDIIRQLSINKDIMNLEILIFYLISLLNEENKLSIDIEETDKFYDMIARILHIISINSGLLNLRDKGLVTIDTSVSDWVIELTDRGREYREEDL